MLTDNEGNNHSVQCQSFTENKHDKHTDKEFVLILRSTNLSAATHVTTFGSIGIRDRRISFLFGSIGKQGNLGGTVPHSANSIVSYDTNTNPCGKARDSRTESGTKMGQARVHTVGAFAGIGGARDGLGEDDSYDESVDTND